MIFAVLGILLTTAAPECAGLKAEWQVAAYADGLLRPERAQLERWAALVPSEGPRARVRQLLQDGHLDGAQRALQMIVAACAVGAGHDENALRAEVQAIVQDPRFVGVRSRDDVMDRILKQLWSWLQSLVESAGVQGFAASTRTIYLAGLVIAAAWVARRLWRSRPQRQRSDAPGAALRIQGDRVRAFRELRTAAEHHLAAGDARGAMLLGEHALLGLVGEGRNDPRHRARTHRELLASLSGAVAEALQEPLRQFDRSLYAHGPTQENARSFLSAVDKAHARLRGDGVAP